MPSLRKWYGAWRLCSYSGLLIPIRDATGQIQGLQIRRENTARMKYVWFSSVGKPYGTAARSWIHVTGDCTQHTAVITEGPLKGDVASALSDNALFICVPGVSAIKYLRLDKLSVFRPPYFGSGCFSECDRSCHAPC